MKRSLTCWPPATEWSGIIKCHHNTQTHSFFVLNVSTISVNGQWSMGLCHELVPRIDNLTEGVMDGGN